jgi:uncharacterized protein (DUF1684 family)
VDDGTTAAPAAGRLARERLDLLDWKRRVAAIYAAVRVCADPLEAWSTWRVGRDELFASHPQSPLPPAARAAFTGLDYFPYDPAARLTAEVVGVEPREVVIGGSGEERFAADWFAEARFVLAGAEASLALFWLAGYAGGLFAAFADATNRRESYGGGRYLLDTVKGSELGLVDGRLLLDFNFAYNPSCCYDPRWSCPLAPPSNRLAAAVRAGERAFAHPG